MLKFATHSMSVLLTSLFVGIMAWLCPTSAARVLAVTTQAAKSSERAVVPPQPGLPTLLAAHWRGDATQTLEHPKWIKHDVTPRERLTQIAARYGVLPRQLRHWNELDSDELEPGDVLRVHAQRIPPPRVRIEHRVRAGETWGSIAAGYRVETRDLHAYNWQIKTLEPDGMLTVWIDPGRPWTVHRRPARPAPKLVDVTPGSISVGRPNRGRLLNAIQVPPDPAYTIREPRITWGSSWAIRHLLVAIHRFRAMSGYEGELVIKSMSRKNGRRFPPHRSHQSGRDVDIALPLLPGVPATEVPHPDEVDWEATWSLITALLLGGEIDLIFLDISVQRRLYEAARGLGVGHDDLRPLIQFPPESGKDVAVVRHGKGHLHHIHVRFSCAPYENRCRAKSR